MSDPRGYFAVYDKLLAQLNKLAESNHASVAIRCKFCGRMVKVLVPHWVEECPAHPIHSATRRPR